MEAPLERRQLKSISHTAARSLLERYPTGEIDPIIVNRELIELCRDPRNRDMTRYQFQKASKDFIPREIQRILRRQARTLAEQTH